MLNDNWDDDKKRRFQHFKDNFWSELLALFIILAILLFTLGLCCYDAFRITNDLILFR
jgi:uncharacterized membrane protein